LGTAYEQAVIGLGNPDYTSDTNLTITLTNSNASQAARCLVLNVTSAFGSLTATRELIVPTIQKQYIVQNNTTGGQSITVKTSAGTGITVPTGRKAHLYVDGTNVIQMFDFVDINGGTIDGATVGAASASTGAFTSLTASGATTLNGAVALGDASGDLITVPGTVNSNLLFTDATYDIGASGATRPRDLFLSRNLTVGGTLTLAGGVNLNGNVTVGDSSADTLTINSTITSNLIFTDNTYDIGASGATRPRSLFLAGNITAAGNQTLTGALTVDSTTDSTSTTTGSIQTDGGVGIAKALFVGTTANIAGVATFSAGSAAAPAITTTGDTNTGIWFPAADTIAFTEGGVESMRIDSAGNLGLGVTPSGWVAGSNAFQVGSRASLFALGDGRTVVGNNTFYDGSYKYIATATASLYTQVSGQHIWLQAASGTAGNAITFTQAMTLNASGDLGIGTTSPRSKLDVSGNVYVGASGATTSVIIGGDSTTTGGFIYEDQTQMIISQITAGPIVFRTTNSERMRILSGGNVGIGTTSPSYLLDVHKTSDGIISRFRRIGATINPALMISANETGNTVGFSTDYAGATSPAMTFTTQATERMRLDASGNLGLGVTPSAWAAGYNAIQFGSGSSRAGALFTNGINDLWQLSNAYFNGTNFIYYATGVATAYNQSNGSHNWRYAASGTAGNAITFTQAMTLDASGNLAIGTTTVASSATDVLTVGKNSASNDASLVIRQFGSGTAAGLQLIAANDTGAAYNQVASSTSGGTQHWRLGGIGGFTGGLAISTSGSERARIDSSGNLLVGTTTAIGKLTVNGAVNSATYAVNITSSSTDTMFTMAASQSYVGYVTEGASNTHSVFFASCAEGSATAVVTNVYQSSANTVVSASGLNIQVFNGAGSTRTMKMTVTRLV
jgi:hypothetical protein